MVAIPGMQLACHLDANAAALDTERGAKVMALQRTFAQRTAAS